jgi:hypothetical protein
MRYSGVGRACLVFTRADKGRRDDGTHRTHLPSFPPPLPLFSGLRAESSIAFTSVACFCRPGVFRRATSVNYRRVNCKFKHNNNKVPSRVPASPTSRRESIRRRSLIPAHSHPRAGRPNQLLRPDVQQVAGRWLASGGVSCFTFISRPSPPPAHPRSGRLSQLLL